MNSVQQIIIVHLLCQEPCKEEQHLNLDWKETTNFHDGIFTQWTVFVEKLIVDKVQVTFEFIQKVT